VLVPAVPPEEYGRYFSLAELAFIFEMNSEPQKARLREALRRWANDDNYRLRLYYRPGVSIFLPETCFHLHDVLAFGTQTGVLRMTPEFLGECRSLENVAPVPQPAWTARPMRAGTLKDPEDPGPPAPE
jgi:hypothetical protein